jgi:thiamine-phosphate pyrophosphorylase
MQVRGYYAILDAAPASLEDDGALLDQARRLLAGAPCCLQLRAKEAGARAMLRAARRLVPLCREHRVPFCVNDRLDVAVAAGADVVHLGQDDLPLADALKLRAELGRPDLVVGFSTHNREQALAAAAQGADYLGFGPVFATASKLNPDPVVGLEALAQVCRAVSVPVVAIGGVGLAAVPAVAASGAASVALISAIAGAADPAAAGRQVNAAFSALSA